MIAVKARRVDVLDIMEKAMIKKMQAKNGTIITAILGPMENEEEEPGVGGMRTALLAIMEKAATPANGSSMNGKSQIFFHTVTAIISLMR